MAITKKHLVWITIAVMLLFGAYLRSWHLDFPSIGYHNMKENEYLVPAYYFYSGNWHGLDILRRPYYLCGVDQLKCYFEEYPQIPLLSWFATVGWMVFGMNFWWPRLLMIVCSVLSGLVLYLLMKRMSKNEYLSLLTMFIYLILPLSVFFGRNFQPESPALLFGLLGTYYFLKWVDHPTSKNVLLSGASFCLAAIFKMTFLIVGFPLLFIFPWERLWQKQYYRQFAYFIACFFPFIFWNFFISGWLNVTAGLGENTFKRVDLLRVFGSAYWHQFMPTLKNYTKDNFAGWYFTYAILGLLSMLTIWKSRLSRYAWGFALALIPYLMILADYFKGHSYYQYPFLPVIAIASAYFLYFIGNLLRQIIRVPFMVYVPLLLLLLTIGSVEQHTNVQWDTIFYGLDAGGKYIQQHTKEGDAFWMVGHSQTVGVCFAAKRVCPGLPRSNLTLIRKGEEEYGIKYMFVHGGAGMAMLQEHADVWDYVRNNYKLVALGFFKLSKGVAPQYYVLKKGGSFDINAQLSGPSRPVGTYTTKTQGTLTLYQMEWE